MGRRIRGQIRRRERMGNRRAHRLYVGPQMVLTISEPSLFWCGAAVGVGSDVFEVVAIDRKAGTITCAPRPPWWIGSSDYAFGGR